jgi:hypothetical protein
MLVCVGEISINYVSSNALGLFYVCTSRCELALVALQLVVSVGETFDCKSFNHQCEFKRIGLFYVCMSRCELALVALQLVVSVGETFDSESFNHQCEFKRIGLFLVCVCGSM